MTRVHLSGCALDCPDLIPPRDAVRLRVYTLDGRSLTVEGTLMRDGAERLGMVAALFELAEPSPQWEALFESL